MRIPPALSACVRTAAGRWKLVRPNRHGGFPSEERQRLVANLNGQLIKLKRLAVLTGAGLSTPSGIPDYRSPNVGRLSTSSMLPVLYSDYLRSADVRRLQWARNFVAWPLFCRFQPNKGHAVVHRWEMDSRIHWLVTQNVDALHTKAGNVHMTELHGTAYRVKCVSCSRQWNRAEFQFYLTMLNPAWCSEAIELAPDCDADLPPDLQLRFREPKCDRCGAIVKPDIVFYGECVPEERVQFVQNRLDECDGLLVLGTSLQVLSSYRLVLLMREQNKPVFIINTGETRADDICTLKLDAKINSVLSSLKI